MFNKKRILWGDNIKKQYRWSGLRRFYAHLDIYHDGKLVDSKKVYIDEADKEEDQLKHNGYTYCYTKKEVEEAKRIYEERLSNVIR